MTSSSTNSDGELIRLAQAGDQRAFQSLAQMHSEPLLGCAVTLTRDRQLAEDIVQETLLEAWRSIGRFDGRCRFSTWLYGCWECAGHPLPSVFANASPHRRATESRQ